MALQIQGLRKMIFSFSSYPLQLPVFVVTAVCLLLACILRNYRWEWMGLVILAGGIGATRLKNDLCMEQACRNWMNARIFYNAAAYGSVEKEYRLLYPLLKGIKSPYIYTKRTAKIPLFSKPANSRMLFSLIIRCFRRLFHIFTPFHISFLQMIPQFSSGKQIPLH